MRHGENAIDQLIQRWVTKPVIIQWIEDRLESDGRLGINIGIQEGLILKSLCSQINVEKVVEIGTQYGCSATWMAMGLRNQGQIFTLERDPECIKNSRLTFQHPDLLATGCQIHLLEGDAKENLFQLEDKGPFDLVFIDANKSGYLDYLTWAKSNIRRGGLILLDNVFLFETMFMDECPDKTPEKMWNVMRQVLSTQLSDDDYSSSLIPSAEGLLLSCKK